MKSFLRYLFVGLVILALLLPSVPAAAAGKGPGLTKHGHELLAKATAEGKKEVTLLIAAVPGSNKTVIDGLATLGARVVYQDSDVSYIRAIVPITNVEKAASLNGIQAADLDEVIPLDDPRPQADGDSVTIAPPDSSTPPLNPYMPTQDIGAPQFVAAHPTWDGRGVKVGILDTGIDLLTPELQTAKALDGSELPKFADWVTYTDPIEDGDPTWINMQDQVTVSGGAFVYNGASYTGAAEDGTLRFGLFHEADLGADSEYYELGDCGPDVNRNGVCDQVFGVLWDTNQNLVWVDANADGSFAGEKAMTDYKVNRDMSTFGTDNPATPVRESVPFVVQTDGKNKFVNIGIVSGAHGTHVAGIATGKGLFGGAFNGAAPEAQIVSIRVCLFVSGCSSHAMIEGMIFAEKQANVDVINMSVGGLPALNDGNNTRAIVYNRLIDSYKAEMFLSAGNDGPGTNTVGDPSVASNAMSIGAYVTKDTWLYNYGAVAVKNEGLFVFTSRGPREDGGFKPDIVAPGSAVSTIPAWQANAPLIKPLPYGYDMYNGTSMAAPQATGGAALLISAAKQSNVQFKPVQLRQAIKSSARYLPAYQAYEQGNGLFQVGAAWELLKTNIKTVGIVSQAPVSTIISQYLARPNYGPGIYQREGWKAGDSKSLNIQFARTTGGSKAIRYSLTWVGNDGTFSSAGSIDLPLNKWVALPVTVNPTTDGIHSAILNLDDPTTSGIDYQVMNTVIAAGQFSAANNFTVSYTGSADRPDKATFFFFVPANTPAFKVDLTGVNGRLRMLRQHPYGVSYDSTSTTAYQTNVPQSRTVSSPTPGVWEVTVDNSRSSLVSTATFTISASILGVDITPASWVIDPAAVGAPYSQNFSFTNRFGAFTGGAVGTSLASAFAQRPNIAPGIENQQAFTINVPADSTAITVQIGNASDASADLDLYLYDCHTLPCTLRASSTSGSAEEFISYANPAAGKWVALVDPYSVPAGSTDYNYIDQVTNPAFGQVSVTDPAALHGNNATWTATATVTANATPGAGRFLRGFVQVRSGSSVLGSSEVRLMVAQ